MMPYRSTKHSDRLPPGERAWVFTGAVLLSGLAGYVNAALLTFYHVPVSHMSGAVSRAGIDLAGSAPDDLRVVGSIVIGFLAGATACGALIGDRKLKPGRRYGVALLLEGVLLAASGRLLLHGNSAGVPMAAMACGIQNAMASSYRGMVIRTTHVTGTVTDLGVMLGYWIRSRRVRLWRALLLLGLLGGFFAGGLAGAVAAARLQEISIQLAALACVVSGMAYTLWMHSRARRPA